MLDAASLYSTDPARAHLLALRANALRAALARESVNEFIEYVGRDEETNTPLKQGGPQRKLQRLAHAHPRLLLFSHPELGKTAGVSVLRMLHELGRDPTLRVVIVSETQSLSRKIARSMQGYITREDSTLREVFPGLVPGRKWTETSFDVARPGTSKDYSVQAVGVGVGVMGTRIDRLCMDDVLTHENTRTEARRKEIKHWFNKTISSRLSRRARVIFMGQAWHPEDLMHDLERTPGWFTARFPVEDADGYPTWPERWPLARIEEKRTTLPPGDFARELLCLARSDDDARFKQDWIDRCLRRGEGVQVTHSIASLPPGYRTYTGVDLGTRDKAGSDLTVFFTILLHPDGTREVLCCESGRWTAPDILERIVSTHERYKSIVAVESNAAQDFLRQMLTKTSAIPVFPFTTGKNKHDPAFGVEALALEIYNGKWLIPAKGGKPATPELGAWIREMLHYTPEAHTGDRLMSSWVSKMAAEGAVGIRRKGKVGRSPVR